ncbi:piggyBac transposable element-derived protein 4-like isoform X1 [Odontomachus brunneus]|uniref:piggyBac transposable element-derived protein 4-like isoform X1 n=1 Tax=Odontomachus brunneus TaxID=486640 RepID=UPI0013F1DBF7|nr:piggyBac transposable element-derived protein 4-like isoform X1 [Odontomachus brunneus]
MEIRSREHLQELQKLLREVEPADEPMDEESLSDDQQSIDTKLLSSMKESSRKEMLRRVQSMYTSHSIPCNIPNIDWFVTPQEKERQKTDHVPEALGAAKDVNTPLEAWSLLFTDEMLNIIIKYTNAEMARKREHNFTDTTDLSDTDLEEIKAFIGFLYFCGLQKNNHKRLLKLWSTLSPLYSLSMSKVTRFALLLQCLRFDDKNTRQERRQRDKLAPICDLWDLFVSNCMKYYSPSKYVTIHKHLLCFRGRCPFRVSSEDKYGLEIVMMNDSETYYMINAIPYVGKINTNRSEPVPCSYVRQLSKPIHKSHRNITCDNWFTSTSLVQIMQEKFSLSIVGEIEPNKLNIPQEMKDFTEVNSIRFRYADNMTLLSYCPKINKTVLILSSLHEQNDINLGANMIQFYNSIKSSTNIFDQLCYEYSTVRPSNRWPTRFFFDILDYTSINSFILYTLNKNNDKIARYKFLETLAKSLIMPYKNRHLPLYTIPHQLQSAKCKWCPVDLDSKSLTFCPQCKEPRCEEHRSMLCENCAT